MCLDPVFILKIYRSGCKICFHDPETFFNLPTLFADLQYPTDIIIKKVRTYGIKTVIHGFFHDLILIQIMFYLSCFSIFCNGCFSYKTGRVVWIFTVLFCTSVTEHLLCTFHLFLTKGSLIESILWRVGNDESLMKFWCCVGHVFVIKSFIISRKFGDIYRMIIGYTFKTMRIQSPLFIIFFQLFNRLCDNISTFTHMVIAADIFRSKACITAIDEFLATEILKDFFL